MSTHKTFLEQLYFGEFFPGENVPSRDPDYWPTCRKIEKERCFISDRLSSEDREHLERLVNLLLDMSCMTDFDNFAYGLRAGVLLMHEVMTP